MDHGYGQSIISMSQWSCPRHLWPGWWTIRLSSFVHAGLNIAANENCGFALFWWTMDGLLVSQWKKQKPRYEFRLGQAHAAFLSLWSSMSNAKFSNTQIKQEFSGLLQASEQWEDFLWSRYWKSRSFSDCEYLKFKLSSFKNNEFICTGFWYEWIQTFHILRQWISLQRWKYSTFLCSLV